jgi:quinol-cytochrome oxidoreductase complex cytochrome b subunit
MSVFDWIVGSVLVIAFVIAVATYAWLIGYYSTNTKDD